MNKTKRQKLTASILTFVMLFQIVAGIFAPVNIFNLNKPMVANAGWFGNDWGYRKEIKVDHTKVANTEQAYFPMLVSLTDPALETIGNGGKIQNPSGLIDVMFTSVNGTTKLDHEVEKYDPVTGELKAWVKIPSLSASIDTSIYMYYGNSAIVTTQENKVGVWDDGGSNNFKMVQHMNQDPGGVAPQMSDSTGHANNGTSGGSMNSVNEVAGQVGEATSFDGTDDYISEPTVDLSSTDAISVSFWAKKTSFSNTEVMFELTDNSSANGRTTGAGIYVNDSPSCSATQLEMNMKGDMGNNYACWNSPSVNVWHYYVFIGDKSKTQEADLYIDGTFQPPVSRPLTENNTNNFGNDPVYLMARGGISFFTLGQMDEVRLSSTVRSADWISTEYNNQSNPTGFYSLGIEEVSFPTALSSFAYRKAITIDHTKVSGNLANFPVLINLAADTSLQAHVQGDADDILFTSSDKNWSTGTVNDKLAHEIETYTSSNGSLQAWVKIPNLSSTIDTVIYMYYGSGGIASQQNKTAVWDTNTKMVQHMNRDSGGLAPQMIDSTQYMNNGTSQGGMTVANSASGQIDGATSFDGTDDYANAGNNSSLNIMNALTISTWIKYTSSGGADTRGIVSKDAADLGESYGLYLKYLDNAKLSFQAKIGGTWKTLDGTTNHNDGNWHLSTVIYNGSNMVLYVDGVQEGSQLAATGTIGTNSRNLFIGSLPKSTGQSSNIVFSGSIDEVRISDTARSADWISTEYRNQSNPTEFYFIGIEEASSPAALSSWGYRKAIIIDHTKVSGASDLSNFPVLINLPADTSLKAHALANGDDILFTPSNVAWNTGTINDKLAHEIETYTTGTGSLQAWVKIPNLSRTIDTVIYLYYGNAAAANQQNKTAVWDTSNKGVWHFANGTTLTAADSTSNGINGTVNAGVAPAVGKIDGAAGFNGTNGVANAIPLSNVPALNGITTAITVSALVKPVGSLAGRRDIIQRSSGVPVVYDDWWLNLQNGGKVDFYADNITGGAYKQSTGAVALNAWSWIDVTYDGSNIKFYINGALDNTVPASGVFHNAAWKATIGQAGSLYNDTTFAGSIDEVRISNTARPEGWITTGYNNQSRPAEFYSLGIEEISSPAALSSWGYRKSITIDHDKVSGASDLSNFPVLINLPADTSLKAHALGSGDDILFTSSSVAWNTGTINDKLAHEIETYTTGTGSLQAWVNIPNLSRETDTVIYMYYGNASATSQQNKTVVWGSGTKMVQHMNQDPGGAAPQMTDSTLYRNNGTVGGGITSANSVAGQVDGATSFNGINNNMNAGHDSSLDMSNTIVLSTWIKTSQTYFNSVPQNQLAYLSKMNATEPYAGYELGITNYRVAGFHLGWFYTNNNLIGTKNISDNAWHYITGVYDGTTAYLYVDGVLDASGVRLNNMQGASAKDLVLGTNYDASLHFNGSLDEVRVSDIVRSADWIKTEYNNQSTPAEFSTLGIEEVSSPVALSVWGYRKAITIDHTRVAGTGDLASFPVLINLPADDSLKINAKASGDDILFTSSIIAWNTGTTNDRLAHEIETYTSSDGSLQAWVKLPNLSHETDTVIYMYYGNAGALNQQNKTDVWDTDTKLVQHMNQAGTGAVGDYKDSTRYANNSLNDANQPTMTTSGRIGAAESFDGIDDIINLGNGSVLAPGLYDASYSLWVKSPDAEQNTSLLCKRENTGPWNQSCIWFADNVNWAMGVSKKIVAMNRVDDSNFLNVKSSTDIADNNWHHVYFLRGATFSKLYIDGQFNGGTINGGLNLNLNNNYPLILGGLGAGAYNLNGLLDEVRYSSVARSDGWIATEYNNQSSPGTFYKTISGEQIYALQITGSATQTAGVGQTMTLTAKGADGNTMTNFTGDKTITFSGANTSPRGDVPTCGGTAFGTSATLTFALGIATCQLQLYKPEAASINLSGIETVVAISPLGVSVSAGAIDNFLVEAPVSGNAGAAFAASITARDTYQNIVSPNGSTALGVSSGTISPASISSGSFTNGVWSGNLTVSNVVENPAVVITATNGSALGTEGINILGVPQSPGSVSASRSNDYSMTLAWQDLSTVESGYKVERKEDSGSGFGAYTQIAALGADISSFIDNAANNPGNTPFPDRKYQYRVRDYNALGDSVYAEDPLVHYTTPDVPADVFADFLTDNGFRVNYTDQAAVTDTHRVKRCSNGNCDSNTFETDLGTFASSPQTDSSGLASNSRYLWEARAETADGINSDYTTSNFEYTTPAAPTIQNPTFVSSTQVVVNWTDNSSYEDGFSVEVSTDGGVYVQVTPGVNTVGASVTSYAFAAQAGHSYRFKVRAHIGATIKNAELFSAYSSESSSVITSISAPTIQTPTVDSATSVTWNWLDNSSSEESFHLHFVSGSGADVSDIPADSIGYQTDGLLPNTGYSVHVHSYRADTGESTASAASAEAHTLSNVPSGLSLTAGNLNGTDRITANWNANQNPAGTEYYVENINTNTNSDWTVDSSWISNNLLCGTEYSFRVKAKNAVAVDTPFSGIVSLKTRDCPSGTSSSTNQPPQLPVITLDNPTGDFKVSIDDGNGYTRDTDVKLTFFAGSDTAKMAISNSEDFSDASIVPYAKEGVWNINTPNGNNADGTHTVYVRFYTKYGIASKAISASVILDTVAPALNITQPKDKYPTTESITLSGTTEPGAKVIYNLDSARVGVIDIGAEGKMDLNLGTLTFGIHSLKLITQDRLGNSSPTMQLFLNVEKTIVALPTVPTAPTNPKPQTPSGTITPTVPTGTTPSPVPVSTPTGTKTPVTATPAVPSHPGPDVSEIATPDSNETSAQDSDKAISDVSPATPASMQGDWNLLSLKPFPKNITTQDIQMIIEKFPEFKETFRNLGLTDFTNAERLKNVSFNIPNLSEVMGLDSIDLTALNLPSVTTPVSELSAAFKKEIPSNIVFVKTKDSGIDIDSVLAFEGGSPDQKVSLLSGKSFQLILRPDQDVNSIQGYLTFKERKLSRVDDTNIAGKIASFFSLNRNALAEQDVEEKLVLSEFKYQDDDQDGIWTADLQTPQVSGEYELITVLNYKDIKLGAKTLRLITVVDPEGYVFENIRGQELHIKDATVSIYQFNPETKAYELWDADKYQQQNPQETDERGTYSFLVPPGSYYLEVKTPGYRDYQGKPFDVTVGSGVHANIELTPVYDWKDSLTWERLLLVVFGIGLFYNFHRDRKLRRKLKVKEVV